MRGRHETYQQQKKNDEVAQRYSLFKIQIAFFYLYRSVPNQSKDEKPPLITLIPHVFLNRSGHPSEYQEHTDADD